MAAPAGARSKHLHGLWGSGPTDVFAVGAGGVIIHYDGDTWTKMQSKHDDNLWSVWGSGPDNVFAVGNGGTVLFYDGRQWAHMETPTQLRLEAVHGCGPHHVLAAGEEATILRFDGASWAEIPKIGWTEWNEPGPHDFNIQDVWCSAPDDIYLAYSITGQVDQDGWQGLEGLHLLPNTYDMWMTEDGKIFTLHGRWVGIDDGTHYWSEEVSDGDNTLWGIWGTDLKNVFAVGPEGGVYHFDGERWTTMDSVTGETLFAVWGSGPNDVFAVGGSGTILHYCQP